MASFSFNCANANKIVMNESYKSNNVPVQYSLDGGKKLNKKIINKKNILFVVGGLFFFIGLLISRKISLGILIGILGGVLMGLSISIK